MVIPDANLLIYAQHSDAAQHEASKAWLEQQFAEHQAIGLTWIAVWAFLRIGSNPKVFRHPPSSEELFDRIDDWFRQPNVVLVQPGSRHGAILRSLVIETGAKGALMTDAVVAAIAIEHAATLASSDRDFRRFSGLRWVNPLDQA